MVRDSPISRRPAAQRVYHSRHFRCGDGRRKYSSLSLFGELIRENYTILQEGVRALQDGDLGQKKGVKRGGNESKTPLHLTSFVASEKKPSIHDDKNRETCESAHHHCTVSSPKSILGEGENKAEGNSTSDNMHALFL